MGRANAHSLNTNPALHSQGRQAITFDDIAQVDAEIGQKVKSLEVGSSCTSASEHPRGVHACDCTKQRCLRVHSPQIYHEPEPRCSKALLKDESSRENFEALGLRQVRVRVRVRVRVSVRATTGTRLCVTVQAALIAPQEKKKH